jgi:hypothetical protein
MKAVVGLAKTNAENSFSVGDIVELQILIDKKIGEASDEWKFQNKTSRWFSSGGFSIDSASLKLMPSEATLTKLEFKAIIHNRGSASLEDLSIIHVASGKEFPLSGQILQNVAAYKENEEAPPWILPTIPIGGWNYWTVSLAVIFLLVVIFFTLRVLLKKLGLQKIGPALTPKEKALKDLDALYFFAKKKNTLSLDDWKKFSFELASILRKYSDKNFEIKSIDLTDREFLAEISAHPKGKRHTPAVANILSTIDEVRYGTKELEVILIPSLIQSAKKYVEDSYIAPIKIEAKK